MAERDLGGTGDNPHLAARANLMTRARKRDVDKGALRHAWERQASELGFSAEALSAHAMQAAPGPFAGPGHIAGEAASWAVEHFSECQAVFSHSDLLAATLAREPGAVRIEAVERAIAALGRDSGLHAATAASTGPPT